MRSLGAGIAPIEDRLLTCRSQPVWPPIRRGRAILQAHFPFGGIAAHPLAGCGAGPRSCAQPPGRSASRAPAPVSRQTPVARRHHPNRGSKAVASGPLPRQVRGLTYTPGSFSGPASGSQVLPWRRRSQGFRFRRTAVDGDVTGVSRIRVQECDASGCTHRGAMPCPTLWSSTAALSRTWTRLSRPSTLTPTPPGAPPAPGARRQIRGRVRRLRRPRRLEYRRQPAIQIAVSIQPLDCLSGPDSLHHGRQVQQRLPRPPIPWVELFAHNRAPSPHHPGT